MRQQQRNQGLSYARRRLAREIGQQLVGRPHTRCHISCLAREIADAQQFQFRYQTFFIIRQYDNPRDNMQSLTSHHLPQHRLEDAAVAVVAHLHRRIDT